MSRRSIHGARPQRTRPPRPPAALVLLQYLQDAFDADLYFQMTDDQKFLENAHLELEETVALTYENTLDVIACGLDPKKTHIFSDTDKIDQIYRIGLRVAKRITFSMARGVFGFRDSDNIGARERSL